MIQENRVIKVNRSYWEIFQNGKVVKGTINNSYKAKMMPAVGDFVVTEYVDDDKVLIVDIRKRKNELVKEYDENNLKFTKFVNNGKQVVAANIDKIFIVTSMNNDFNIGKMERFIILSDIPDVQRYIVLSKADVCENEIEYVDALTNKFPHVEIITTSAVTGQGLKELLGVWKKGETAVFIGSSGVGKSTLVNKLYGQEITKTNDVRKKDDKGRHTTSASTLFEVDGGRFIIDTPGVREVGLSNLTAEKIAEVFDEIENLSQKCKRYKCTHTKEDGCAVKDAVEKGIIDKKIVERYIKLKNAKNIKKQKGLENKSFKDKAKSRNKKYFKRNNEIDEDL